ncbi:TrbC/VirB2 family protein [Legionella pneumophila serogroup 1]|nr:TrbC/VirB2 family protein [Legionella pneumophila]HAU1314483.1 TrbC/VirB2 family protein [Legionella pneumophila]HBI5778490.1 TrbC/VirB2 family protein [Legionella pneumophila]HBJ7666195.1 TrbC/VirB2 family protein [Legionella pneumophila]HDU8068275.1 TrbC/VirB2 family protein [Legionella pneumophila]
MTMDKQQSKRAFQKIRTLYWGTACLCAPSVSSAQSIESIINRTINYLQGGLARTVGVFCIILAGYLCLARQKFPKEYFVMILVGMGIIFGGSSLYSTLIG